MITLPSELGTQTNTYDPAGNLIAVSYSDGTVFGFSYDANDRLLTANNGGATPNNITRAYDANGRLTNTNGIAIERDAGGRITSMTLATGKVVSYAYDDNDRLVSVTDWAGGTTSFGYDDAGRLLSISRPNVVTTTNTWDKDSRLLGIAEGTISSISLTRDPNGQITSAIRNVPLTPSARGFSSSENSFDAAAQIAGYSYDGLGRLTGANTSSFTWDLASRLKSYTAGGSSVSNTYDALDRRLSRTNGGVARSYVWNEALGIVSISVERQGGADLRYYIHTPGGALLYSMDAATNSRRFYHYDEMGNTIAVTDDSGTVIGSYAYTPYGILTASTGALDNPFTWQGQYGVMDEGDSLYYIRARYYDSGTGRFISRDSVRQTGPKSVNPYQYALNNPKRIVDVNGFKTEMYSTWDRFFGTEKFKSWHKEAVELHWRIGARRVYSEKANQFDIDMINERVAAGNARGYISFKMKISDMRLRDKWREKEKNGYPHLTNLFNNIDAMDEANKTDIEAAKKAGMDPFTYLLIKKSRKEEEREFEEDRNEWDRLKAKREAWKRREELRNQSKRESVKDPTNPEKVDYEKHSSVVPELQGIVVLD